MPWCNLNIPKDDFLFLFDNFMGDAFGIEFKKEEDALVFKLKFGL